ncbi:semaphorin-4E [Electrophorus electricus]|uniref:Semaphorin-1A n=1 Tax=Electrophorus electricus TaxID=8005 RepID=A0A4W4E6V5_ELEEL|nr:semaphorin-4E [Electrophorus electricus]XP_035384178.1 semaphorin-4E [Electrophorus electricus]
MLWLLLLCVWALGVLPAAEDWPAHTEPRKSFSLSSNGGRVFREQGVWNYSTMLLREDLGLLILGARESIFALELTNITHKMAMVKWEVTTEMQDKCSRKGKNLEIECQNYIRVLHRMSDGRMYVCGTNAFSPTCDIMSYTNDTLTLENQVEDGKGKCPFDPFQRYTSELVDGELFSATSINFLGSEPVMMRSSVEPVRTEFKTSWLNEPTFIGMEHIAEGQQNPEGDDDKMYLFFIETAVEYDFYNKLEVSRVARVCKNDMGGQRTLQRKWTSFVKARLDCPVRDTSLPFLIQDVFRFCPGDWRTCVFYAVFIPQADTSYYSAVCAYKVSDIREVFSEGKFKIPVTVETSFVKWVMYSGELPFPRPGACINNEARQRGYHKSLDLPDKTLQFIRDKPLMDQAVQPVTDGPLLVKKGAAFTRIVVANATALDGSSHEVMFIGTESGSVLKAVNYDGEMVIIEELQVFQHSEPIKILRLSNELYAGSEVGAAQIPLSSCDHYGSCLDCVLARDPYCGWDLAAERCAAISSVHPDAHSQVIQSLRDGNATRCPPLGSGKAANVSFLPGFSVKLLCQPGSNLAQLQWHVDGHPIVNSNTHHIHRDGLIILNASASAVGRYTCTSVESSRGRDYVTQNVVYELSPRAGPGGASGETMSRTQGRQHNLLVLVVMVVLLSLTLAALVLWNFHKGYFALPERCRQEQRQSRALEPLQAVGRTPPAPRESSNSNHNRSVDCSNTEEKDHLNQAHR